MLSGSCGDNWGGRWSGQWRLQPPFLLKHFLLLKGFFLNKHSAKLSAVACGCCFTLSNFYIQICKISWNYGLTFLHLGNEVFRENCEECLFITFLKEEFAVVSYLTSFQCKERTCLKQDSAEQLLLFNWRAGLLEKPFTSQYLMEIIYTMCRKKATNSLNL